jgi:hypothetical protein
MEATGCEAFLLGTCVDAHACSNEAMSLLSRDRQQASAHFSSNVMPTCSAPYAYSQLHSFSDGTWPRARVSGSRPVHTPGLVPEVQPVGCQHVRPRSLRSILLVNYIMRWSLRIKYLDNPISGLQMSTVLHATRQLVITIYV